MLNPAKFVFAQEIVEFAGFEITLDSVRPCERYLAAIKDFPTPKKITNIRSWFGLIHQVSYASSMTDHMLPFREFLKPDTAFRWNARLDTLLEESKMAIVSEIKKGVTIFDKSRPTCLVMDWSKTGIGFTLFQKRCDCPNVELHCCRSGWKVVLVGN